MERIFMITLIGMGLLLLSGCTLAADIPAAPAAATATPIPTPIASRSQSVERS